MARTPQTVLAIDPGSHKCGIAVLTMTQDILYHAVINTADLHASVQELAEKHLPSVILIGDGTTADAVAEAVTPIGVTVEPVDETLTSVAARKRYFAHNPPRGLRRLIPVSLQTPGRPYDDYVAIILAERYLAEQH